LPENGCVECKNFTVYVPQMDPETKGLNANRTEFRESQRVV
jgi:hypothetical protein